MGKKSLIPEEKWEGLRHAMEEAAGTRKTSKTPGFPPTAEGEAARSERGKKRGAGEEGKKERKGEKGGKKIEEKKKEGRKGRRGKGKRRRTERRKRRGRGRP